MYPNTYSQRCEPFFLFFSVGSPEPINGKRVNWLTLSFYALVHNLLLHFEPIATLNTMIYYRPQWTCGRYNKQKNVALMYNLIEGMSYFFENYSALVIGTILSIKRCTEFTLEEISKQTDIDIASLQPFIDELIYVGLITIKVPDNEYISNYRNTIRKHKLANPQTSEDLLNQKLPLEATNAEVAYFESVDEITSVMFELTYRCSEKCIHCYNPGATRNDNEISTRGKREELTLNDYKRIIDELYEQGLVKVCLSGGDPFSQEFVWELIDYLYHKEIAIDIYTNGQKLVHKVGQLANYYPRVIGISLYSGKAEEHDFITRIKGSWDKTMQVIEEVSALAIPLNIKCCVMHTNVKHYYMVADIAKRFGAIPQFELSLTDSLDGDKCVSQHLRLSPDLLEIVLRDKNTPLYVGKEKENWGSRAKNLTRNTCGAGYQTFCISPEGLLMPCCAFHTSFGNLSEKSVKEILKESKELKWWRNLTLEQYEECGRHDYCDFCNLCPGNNFSEFGTPLKAAENNCYMAKCRYNLAQKMEKEDYDPLKGKALNEALQTIEEVKDIDLKRELSNNYANSRLKVGG